MTTALTSAHHIRRETLVSAVINGLISAGFFLLMFARADPVPVWGIGNYAFDFVPQSFAVGFMATLVPGLLCRRAIAAGRIAEVTATRATTGAVVARAVLQAIAAVVVGAGTCALLLWATGAEAIGNAAAFALKVLYGAALGALITRITLARMLA